MDNDGSSKDDVKVPDSDLGKQIAADFEEGKDLLVTIISAMGEEQVCSVLCSFLKPSHFSCRPSPSRRLQKALNDSCFRNFLQRHDSPSFITRPPFHLFSFQFFFFVRPVHCCLIVVFLTTRRSLVVFQPG